LVILLWEGACYNRRVNTTGEQAGFGGGRVTQWERVRQSILGGICSGRWPAGSVLPSEEDLARQLGVSRITVRRALQELRAAGLVVTARGQRTQVVYRPRRPAATSGVAVALSLPVLANDLDLAVMRGVQAELAPLGYTVLMTSADNDATREAEQLEFADRLGVRGVVLYPVAGVENAALVRELVGRRRPVVYVGRYHPTVEADRVVADNVHGAEQGVEFLFRRGHRRILFVNGREQEVSAVTERLQGYLRAHELLGLPVDFRLVQMDLLDVEAQESRLHQRLAALWSELRPTAALAVNGPTAIRFLRHVQALELDCEVVGFASSAMRESLVGLAAVLVVPTETMGREAARLLNRRLLGDWQGWPAHHALALSLVEPALAADEQSTVGRERH